MTFDFAEAIKKTDAIRAQETKENIKKWGQEGRDAFAQGVKRHKSPYLEGSLPDTIWVKGWNWSNLTYQKKRRERRFA